MYKPVNCMCLALALMAAAAMGSGNANAQDFLSSEWLLNPSLSTVYMQTAKANAIIETHQFTAVEGSVSKDGEATVKIDLASIETGVDVRDVRLRFLLFEAFKFPRAEISARLDKGKLQALSTETRVSYPLKLTVSMHGVTKDQETLVWVTRLNNNTVSVATAKPIIVTAESFGLSNGVVKLSEAVGGTAIVSAASITFDLVFATGDLKPELEAARTTTVGRRAEEAASPITAEACETRFGVISKTGAIRFKTGSAELDQESAPLLNSVADIANRCPSVKIDVEGHTDNIGNRNSNRELSEQRAKSVVDYLTGKGVGAARIRSAGYGGSRPVASNDTEADRSKNRRIEFKVNNE